MKPQDRTRVILRSQLDPWSRLVGLAIADHMNSDDEEVWPAVARLIELTGLAERTVRDVLASGRRLGWLLVAERPGIASRMRIDWAALAVTNGARTSGKRKGKTPAPAAGPTPAPRAGEPLRPMHETPAPAAGHPCAPLHSEFSENSSLTPEDSAETATARSLRIEATKKQTSEATSEAPNARPTPAAPPVAKVPREPDLGSRARPIAVPAPEPDWLTVHGKQIPNDLPALLFGVRAGNRGAVQALLNAGIENAAGLLELTADERRYLPQGPGKPLWNTIGAHLRATWGIDLGALAGKPPTTGPPDAPAPSNKFAAADADRNERTRKLLDRLAPPLVVIDQAQLGDSK